jgi:hypothetical protein
MKNKPQKGSKGKNDHNSWQKKTYEIIFESDTFYGKLFDELLLAFIVLSIAVVNLTR